MDHKRNISKSSYVKGLQCKKMLWYVIHERDLAEEYDEATERLFELGTRVGELATRNFENGVLIDEDHGHLGEAAAHTEKSVEEGYSAIFEATAIYKRVLSRVDILKKVRGKKNTWDIYEVKMSTRVKDVHIPDIAIQKYCFEGAGYTIRKTFLMHVDTGYVRHEDIDPKRLLVAEDVTERVNENMQGIGKRVTQLLRVMDSKTCPKVAPGAQCESPYLCAYWSQCNQEKEKYSIYELSRGRKQIEALEELDIYYLKDIPEDFALTPWQQMQVASAKEKRPVIKENLIRAHLDKLQYPLYFFDFETTECAIPLFEGTRPYMAIPFQYSLHVQARKGGGCRHLEFLPEDRQDPREKLAKQMIKDLGTRGTIVAYNMSFEKTRIKDLAKAFPAYSEKLLALLPRFWDLIVPFQKSYAHYQFHGSASIKNVLPVMVPELSYKALSIQEGYMASLKAQKWFFGDMDEREWKTTRADLLKYCGMDTLAMVEILRVLYEGAGEK